MADNAEEARSRRSQETIFSPFVSTSAFASSSFPLSANTLANFHRRLVRNARPPAFPSGRTAQQLTAGVVGPQQAPARGTDAAPEAPCACPQHMGKWPFKLTQPPVDPKEVPPSMVVNRHIRYGYKVFGLSTAECFYSMFELNNETMNVVSGWAIVLQALVRAGRIILATTTRRDDQVFFSSILAISALMRVLAWTFATLAHAHSTHGSPERIRLHWQLDYAGVYLTIMGYFNFLVYVELSPCAPAWAWGASMALGSAACACALARAVRGGEAYQREENRARRAAPFVITQLFYCFPLLWKLRAVGFYACTPYLWAAIGATLASGLFFVSCWPERSCCSFLTNVLVPSHSLWHWGNFASDAFFYTAAAMAAAAGGGDEGA